MAVGGTVVVVVVGVFAGAWKEEGLPCTLASANWKGDGECDVEKATGEGGDGEDGEDEVKE